MILTLQPDRVAMLTYVHYPILFENQRKIPQSSIPNSFMRVLLSQLAEEVFTDRGYKKIGFDHYARSDNKLYTEFSKGNVCRDLMGYSIDERRAFIGLGSSAISFMNNTFYHNMKSLHGYYDLLNKNNIP
jgi:oxygen-independent coproporphyrinogen-3 oxidase